MVAVEQTKQKTVYTGANKWMKRAYNQALALGSTTGVGGGWHGLRLDALIVYDNIVESLVLDYTWSWATRVDKPQQPDQHVGAGIGLKFTHRN